MNFSTTELISFGVGIVGCLLLNAVFVATEFALMKLRFTRFGTDNMDAARELPPVAYLLDNMGASLKALRLGVTLCSVALGFLLLPLALAAMEAVEWMGELRIRIAMLVGFALAVGFHFVLGEMVPRAMAMQYPIQSLKATVPVVRLFRFAAKPLSVFLNGASSGMLKLLRLDPGMDFNLIEVESQIRSIVSEGEELPKVTESILSNVMDLRKRVAHDIMIPRNQLKYLDTQDTLEENLKIAREEGHTRFPLCEGDLDQCIGIVHIKDLFRRGKHPEDIDLNEVKRPVSRFSMDEPLEAVLQEFLKQKQHFALLIDEFGGAVGAVTLEDVLEELVGEIQDEFDRDKEMISKLGDGAFLVDGLTPLHDVSEEIGVPLESGEVSTFGGYITLSLGRMPRLRESFRVGRLEIVAGNVDDRRVLDATVRVLPESPASEEAAGESSVASRESVQ